MIVELVLLVLALLAGYYLHFKRKTSYFKDKGIPFVEPYFIFGTKDNLKMFMGKVHFIKLLESIYWNFKQHPIVGYFNFDTPWVMVNDIDLIKQVIF